MATKEKTQKALKRFKQAQGRKSNWEEFYRDALRYYAPQFETFTEQSPGQDERGQGLVFDSTPQNALMKFASNLQSSLVPPGKDWIRFLPGQEIEQENKEDAQKQLDIIREVFFTALKNSNFDTQVSESFLDLALGTGALLAQKGTAKEPIVFSAVPLSELYLDEGPHGRPDAVFRKFRLPIRAIEGTWADAKVPKELKDKAEHNPASKVTVVEATIPDDVVIFSKQANKKVKVKGFRHMVMTQDGKHLMVEREQESSPWIIFRWAVRPGEIYGRGPAMMALSDTKTINKVKELILKNAAMAVPGAFTVADDGIINVRNIRIEPGSLIPVSSNPGGVSGPTIAALPRSGDFNVGQIVIQDLRQSINEILLADPLGPVDAPVKTATEISIRQAELAKRSGASFGRLIFEFLTPLVNRVLFLLEEFDMIDLNDFRVDGRFISIEHISPIAQAQDQEELIGIERLMSMLVNTFGPQTATALVNSPKLVTEIAQLLNVKTELVASEQQMIQMMQAIANIATEAGGQGAAVDTEPQG